MAAFPAFAFDLIVDRSVMASCFAFHTEALAILSFGNVPDVILFVSKEGISSVEREDELVTKPFASYVIFVPTPPVILEFATT